MCLFHSVLPTRMKAAGQFLFVPVEINSWCLKCSTCWECYTCAGVVHSRWPSVCRRLRYYYFGSSCSPVYNAGSLYYVIVILTIKRVSYLCILGLSDVHCFLMLLSYILHFSDVYSNWWQLNLSLSLTSMFYAMWSLYVVILHPTSLWCIL